MADEEEIPAADPATEEAPVNEDIPEGTELPELDEDAPDQEGEGDPNEDDDAPQGIGARIEKDPFEMDFLVKLPNIISFTDIPSVNECRSVWRLGMRKIEECFAEHIANLHMDFEDKAKEFEKIQN